MATAEVLTIGHSTLPAERFLSLLVAGEVTALVDVRRYPGSRRNPQFNVEALAADLTRVGIGYEPMGESLGGRRSPRPGSANKGWRVESFRAYADHMETAEFGVGLERLEAIASASRAAVMCAEADWHRCHRRLLADALTISGWRVVHVRADREDEVHQLTPFAVAGEGRLSYPPPQGKLDA